MRSHAHAWVVIGGWGPGCLSGPWPPRFPSACLVSSVLKNRCCPCGEEALPLPGPWFPALHLTPPAHGWALTTTPSSLLVKGVLKWMILWMMTDYQVACSILMFFFLIKKPQNSKKLKKKKKETEWSINQRKEKFPIFLVFFLIIKGKNEDGEFFKRLMR